MVLRRSRPDAGIIARSRASSPENRFSVRLFLTASASAFRWPMSTTSFLPRTDTPRFCIKETNPIAKSVDMSIFRTKAVMR